jgi:hypothetical protein
VNSFIYMDGAFRFVAGYNCPFWMPCSTNDQSSKANSLNGKQYNDLATEQQLENERGNCCYLGWGDYMKAGSQIIPVGLGMDISKLPIGSYRLDVQATDSTGKSTAWRSANFTVE